MCLYPRLIINRKYTKTKKNKGIIPEIKDERTKYVPIGCGKCIECSKKKARDWTTRLQEEIRTTKPEEAHFVTLTFSTQALEQISYNIIDAEGYEMDNAICTYAIRHFLERWRKKTGKSVKHWFITELGTGRYEHVHIHGLIFAKDKQLIKDLWKMYGHTFIGHYVNERTINYITKYCYKTDQHHKEYKPKILTSPGIGNNYIKRHDAKLNKYNEQKGRTKETYHTRSGHKMSLPIYYRNQIYTEDQREKLWIEKLDKDERWILGTCIRNASQNTNHYYKKLEVARRLNKQLGYGNDEINWSRHIYENTRRKMIYEKRFQQLLC